MTSTQIYLIFTICDKPISANNPRITFVLGIQNYVSHITKFEFQKFSIMSNRYPSEEVLYHITTPSIEYE